MNACEVDGLSFQKMRMSRRTRLDVCVCAYIYVYMAETVRIDPAAHAALAEIARAKQLSLTEALSQAVESYRRELFLEGLASDFAALRADVDAWADEQVEREAWDITSGDGLEDKRPGDLIGVHASQPAVRPSWMLAGIGPGSRALAAAGRGP